MEELKPCPFCGGEAHIERFDMSKWAIGCDSMQCMGYWSCTPMYDSEYAAIKAWNTRAEQICKNVYRGREFLCSKCNTAWHTLIRDDAYEWQKTNPQFCPNCGAKVIGAIESVDDD